MSYHFRLRIQEQTTRKNSEVSHVTTAKFKEPTQFPAEIAICSNQKISIVRIECQDPIPLVMRSSPRIFQNDITSMTQSHIVLRKI
jgi:hypothetical protein